MVHFPRKQGVRQLVLNTVVNLRPLRLLNTNLAHKMSLDLLSHFSKVGVCSRSFSQVILAAVILMRFSWYLH